MRSFTTSLIAAAAVTAAAGPAPASAAEMRLMTGPQGGVWVPLGGQLKDMWEKAVPGLAVQSLPGAGIANVRGIEEGKAEIGFANSISTVDAVAGKRAVQQAARQCLQCRDALSAVLPGRGARRRRHQHDQGPQGQGVHHPAERQHRRADHAQLLKVNGLTYNDVKVSFVVATPTASTQMKDGHAVAFALGTTIPAGAIMDLASARDIKLLDLSRQLEEMQKINPGYTLVTIPKGTYPKQDKDVQVIGYATHIVASCKLPEDTVYKMTKAIAANISDAWRAVVKASAALTPKAWRRTSACRSIPARRSSTRKPASTVKSTPADSR